MEDVFRIGGAIMELETLKKTYIIKFYHTVDKYLNIEMPFFYAMKLWRSWSNGDSRFDYNGMAINLDNLCLIEFGKEFWDDYLKIAEEKLFKKTGIK